MKILGYGFGHAQPVCMFDRFHLTFNFKSKVSCHIFKKKKSVNWHIHLFLKYHFNFALHNILEKLSLCIIKIQSWLVTKKNYQSCISILRSRMFLQILLIAQSIASTSSPQRETSRVFKFNLLRKWLLIALCLENTLTNSYTWWHSIERLKSSVSI